MKKPFANAVKEPVIIVRPVGEQRRRETLTHIKDKTDPSKLAVEIESMRVIKNGGVAISCSTKESIGIVKNKFIEQFGDKYNVGTKELRNPQIIAVGVEEKVITMKEEEIIDALIKKKI